MSLSSPWVMYARLNESPDVVAARMHVNRSTAVKRLAQARAALGSEATPRQADAVAVIQASGAVRQEVSRRSWQDVLLGYKRVSQHAV